MPELFKKKQTYKNFKIVVVDDASTDNSVEYLHVNFPEFEVRALAHNKGFARTVNHGIVHALKKYSPEFIAILNNDTAVDEQWIEALMARIKTDPTIAAVTSNMFLRIIRKSSTARAVQSIGMGTDTTLISEFPANAEEKKVPKWSAHVLARHSSDPRR
ncbi:MAG: glycosyltransferase [Patescibacteria group bacterium]